MLQVKWLKTFYCFVCRRKYTLFYWFINIISDNNINININPANNFDEDDPDTIILIRFSAWNIRFEKRKALKKELYEELMPVLKSCKSVLG